MWFTLFDLIGFSTVSPHVKETKKVSDSGFQSPGFLIFRIAESPFPCGLWTVYNDLTNVT